MCSSCKEPAENNIRWGVFHSKIWDSKIYMNTFLKRHYTRIYLHENEADEE